MPTFRPPPPVPFFASVHSSRTFNAITLLPQAVASSRESHGHQELSRVNKGGVRRAAALVAQGAAHAFPSRALGPFAVVFGVITRNIVTRDLLFVFFVFNVSPA